MHSPLRLFALLIIILLPILANPLPDPESNTDSLPAPEAIADPTTDIAALTAAKALVPKDAEPGTKILEVRSALCTIVTDGVRYRTCPRTSCPAVGQYPKGTVLTFICYKTRTTVNGNSIWDKASEGYYSADAYVTTPCLGELGFLG